MMKKFNIENLKGYFEMRDDVIAAYVFGSYASKRFTAESDIDIAALLYESVNSKNYGKIRQDILGGIAALILTDRIDLVILNIAPPLLCHEVIKKGALLYSRDEKKRIEFTVKSTMRYLDTTYLRSVQDKILHDKIRSGNFGYFKGSRKYSIEKIRKSTPDTSAVK